MLQICVRVSDKLAAIRQANKAQQPSREHSWTGAEHSLRNQQGIRYHYYLATQVS